MPRGARRNILQLGYVKETPDKSTFRIRPNVSGVLLRLRFAGRHIHNSPADFVRSSDMELNTFNMNPALKCGFVVWFLDEHIYFVKVLVFLNRFFHPLVGKR